ncbi:MAG: glycosyltransferase, partial [Clostridia bacterium]|nr:glycosyltransferase [Clostridia bacterium]
MISIIVPVYKAEKYLDNCINSLLSQTYTDLEIILVDDGAPDASGAICDAYATKDSRIKVIHQQNGGLSA